MAAVRRGHPPQQARPVRLVNKGQHPGFRAFAHLRVPASVTAPAAHASRVLYAPAATDGHGHTPWQSTCPLPSGPRGHPPESAPGDQSRAHTSCRQAWVSPTAGPSCTSGSAQRPAEPSPEDQLLRTPPGHCARVAPCHARRVRAPAAAKTGMGTPHGRPALLATLRPKGAAPRTHLRGHCAKPRQPHQPSPRGHQGERLGHLTHGGPTTRPAQARSGGLAKDCGPEPAKQRL